MDAKKPFSREEKNVQEEKIVQAKKFDGLEAYVINPANDASGYGKFGRYFLNGLYERGVKVQLDLFRIPDFRSSLQISPSLSDMINTKVSDDAPSIWAVMPPKFYHRQGRKILFTMMETNGVHESFLEKVNRADELWVPTLHNMRIFKEAGVKIPIYHMPLGVDFQLYKPFEPTEEQKSIFKINKKSFSFLSLFGWSLRKGYDVLLKAYLKAFTSDDDVSLVIASRKDGSTHVDKIREIRETIGRYIAEYCPNPSKAPHIVHIGQAMPEEQLPILYNMCDCFCLISRGEGFCMPMSEAGACEKPVIGSRCTGQMDFLNDDNSFLVDPESYGTNQDIAEISSYYQGMPFAVFKDKAVDQCAGHMRDVFENYDQAKGKAIKLRKNLEENFTWDQLTDRIYARLLELK